MYTRRPGKLEAEWGSHYEKNRIEKEPVVEIDGGGIDFSASKTLQYRRLEQEAEMAKYQVDWDEELPNKFNP